ncbi:pyridoxamine 5'-phosphate oxidase family protein [Bacillus sp. FJAT-44742]|uniref:pyridoxamine 5'-phosphate oxidase family protein n=1 Tax=Bacillus sp. FJAT-44742 TaxID=2014005 RepID=UPI000C240007|nr:pyridoxamine 5'-phosphate oxidase family protein [Bacillus sp. FJAT-44742]
MANKVEQQLTEDLLPLLQKERYVTIATVDYETNIPNVNAISWVFAPDSKRVCFAIDNRSRIVENIKKNHGMTMTVIGSGSTYSISGKASIKAEKLDGVPLKLALIELSIDEIRDVMFYGARISTEPSYEKTYDAEAAAKLDKQVMDAMKKA